MNKGIGLWNKAKKIIPGGSQLLSKRAEMFLPEQWPTYYNKVKGVEVWDLEGNRFIDMSLMGVGSCVLGYSDDYVNNYVKHAIENGSMCTLNCLEEVVLAKMLIELHPWASKVRYARTGGEAMAIAVRIARVYSGKDRVAFCSYSGWHDWYLSANLEKKTNLDIHLLPSLEPKGVPKCLKGTAIPFEYNNIEQLNRIVNQRSINKVGVIVVEPMRHEYPKDNFLQKIRNIANEIGAVLIFDEITSGFRMELGGVHKKFGVTPDICVFGKAMSNGYPMSAIIGNDVMDAAQDTFISSTYWTERIGPTAAIATINKIKMENVIDHLEYAGSCIRQIWVDLAKKHNLNISILPPNPLITFKFNYDNELELRTLFTQEMLKLGYLASTSVYVSYAHSLTMIMDVYSEAVDKVFKIISEGIKNNNIMNLLEGPVVHSGFRRV